MGALSSLAKTAGFMRCLAVLFAWCVCFGVARADDASTSSGDVFSPKRLPRLVPPLSFSPSSKRPKRALVAQGKRARPKTRRKQKKENAARKTIGDLSFRFDVGLDLFRLSLASGELITENIGTRSYRLNLNLEYGYFFGNNTVLYVSLPFAFDIDPIVGTFFFLDIGVGARQYFGRFLFADLAVRLTLSSFSRFLFGFGGFVLGIGGAIPIGDQVRLLIIARAPFDFFGGFRFRLLGQIGVEALF